MLPHTDPMPRSSYAVVLAGAVLCYAALGAVLRILPTLESDRALLGLLVGAPAVTAIVTRPLGGRLADRLGPAPVMLAGAVVMAVGVLPMLASGVGWLIASRLVVGAGEGAMMSATVLWLLRLGGPAHRGRSLGHIGLANYAGLTAGPLIASAVGLTRAPVAAAAAMLPLAGGLIALAARRPPPERAERDGGGNLRSALIPGVGLMLVNVGYVALLTFGAATTHTALVIPIFAAGVIAARTIGGSVPDRVGAAPTLVGATAASAAGLVTIALAGASGWSLAGTLVLAVGQGLAVPALGLLALSRVAPERHGAAAGLFFAFFDAGVGAGGPLVGLIARLTSPAGSMAAAAAFVGVAGAVPLARRRSRRLVRA